MHYIAVFGAGRAGIIHLRNLVTKDLKFRAQVLYLVDPDEDARRRADEAFRLAECGTILIGYDQAEKVYRDARNLLPAHVHRVDGIIVASTTNTHEEINIAALQHGKSVFCEKPLSFSLEGIRKCYEVARKAGAHLHCSFNRRFDPTFDDLRERIRRGESGKVHRLVIVSRDCPKPSYDYLRIAGNIVHDCAIHDIDMSAWLLGEQPVEVCGQAHTHDPVIASYNDWDSVCITMKYPSNAIVTVDIDRLACYGYHQTIEVFGDKARLESQMLNPCHTRIHTSAGSFNQLVYNPATFSFPERYKESFVRSMENFLDVLEGRAEPSVTGDEVAKDCIVADAIIESIRTKRVVKINV